MTPSSGLTLSSARIIGGHTAVMGYQALYSNLAVAQAGVIIISQTSARPCTATAHSGPRRRMSAAPAAARIVPTPNARSGLPGRFSRSATRSEPQRLSCTGLSVDAVTVFPAIVFHFAAGPPRGLVHGRTITPSQADGARTALPAGWNAPTVRPGILLGPRGRKRGMKRTCPSR